MLLLLAQRCSLREWPPCIVSLVCVLAVKLVLDRPLPAFLAACYPGGSLSEL